MCGIAGFYGKTDEKSIPVIRRMLTRIKHRGPDQSGIYASENVALGSVRLSIIDLDGGVMPISDYHKTCWIVFNGEIFNYIELRDELIKKGYRFKTTSDTEVVINLFKEYGYDFLNKLNGQFAIAIWDKDRKELFLARDRIGIRPLFYTKIKDTLIFASEIKAFIEYPGFKPKISSMALQQYYTFWSVLTPNTIFEDVFEVPPANYVIVNDQGVKSYNYWEIPASAKNNYVYNDLEEASKKFEELFEDAVKIRLRADVPVAAYLSGGIDSSITTSFIKKCFPDNFKTYSIGFEEKEFDESYYQKIASNYFNTSHLSINCTSDEILSNFKKVVWHCEAPLLRTSPVPMGILAKNVRSDNTKVVITGEGADEFFGGYNIFKETKIRRFWAKDPDSKYRPLLLKRLYSYLPQIASSKSNILKMFFGFKLDDTKSPIYSHILRWNNTSRIRNYLLDDFKKLNKEYKPIEEVEKELENELKNYDYLTKAQLIEIKFFMSSYLLSSQGDRMAMAHSVEGRYPFLDHRLIEFSMSMNPDLKLYMLNEKYLLKKTMKGKIPNEILNRSKQAYRAPIKSVFTPEELSADLKEIISKDKIEEFGIFAYNKVAILLQKFKSNKRISEIDNMALTALISTQLLFDIFINKNYPDLKKSDFIKFDKIVKDY